jgi:hypothetical protein
MSDAQETEVEKKKGAKEYSLFAQIFAAVWVAALTILKGMNIIALDTVDIIYTAIAIVGIFSPVYISIFLEKIRDIRFGSTKSPSPFEAGKKA